MEETGRQTFLYRRRAGRESRGVHAVLFSWWSEADFEERSRCRSETLLEQSATLWGEWGKKVEERISANLRKPRRLVRVGKWPKNSTQDRRGARTPRSLQARTWIWNSPHELASPHESDRHNDSTPMRNVKEEKSY